jgi:hypothetical protein
LHASNVVFIYNPKMQHVTPQFHPEDNHLFATAYDTNAIPEP